MNKKELIEKWKDRLRQLEKLAIDIDYSGSDSGPIRCMMKVITEVLTDLYTIP